MATMQLSQVAADRVASPWESRNTTKGVPRSNTVNQCRKKNHVCGECGYAAKHEGELKKHTEVVHETLFSTLITSVFSEVL